MASNLAPETLRDFIVSDFESAWNALAAVREAQAPGRGNFMFGRQAMTLLELAARMCAADAKALGDLSSALLTIDPLYFTALPSPTARPGEFDLPYDSGKSPMEAQLIWILYDLVRNGQAHQYQQIFVPLKDGKTFGVSLVGVPFGCPFPTSPADRPKHLTYSVDAAGDVWIRLHPDWLLFDFKQAIASANIFGRGLTLEYLARPRTKGGVPKQLAAGTRLWDHTSTDVAAALKAAGHSVAP